MVRVTGLEPVMMSPCKGDAVAAGATLSLNWRKTEESNPTPFREQSVFKTVPTPCRLIFHSLITITDQWKKSSVILLFEQMP
jgi:hypothetical protein